MTSLFLINISSSSIQESVKNIKEVYICQVSGLFDLPLVIQTDTDMQH